MNYLAVIAMLLHLLLHAWMDASKITEGTAFVLMTFAGKVFIAYLTSWIFLTANAIRERSNRIAFYRNQVNNLLDEFTSFIFRSFVLTHRVEDKPLKMAEYAELIQTMVLIFIEYDKKEMADIRKILRLEMYLSNAKLSTMRTLRKLRERRHADEDAFFEALELLEYAFFRVPELPDAINKHRQGGATMRFEDLLSASEYYAKRINELLIHATERGWVKSDAIEEKIHKRFADLEEIMRTDLEKNAERWTMERLREEKKKGSWNMARRTLKAHMIPR